MRAKFLNPQAEFSALTKQELHSLADGLLEQDPSAIELCVDFVVAETKGLWHGRARAMMCRRLKHCQFGKYSQVKLKTCILNRLRSGNFSEQFKDQLRLALHLDEFQTLVICKELASSSTISYVKRYSQWALSLPHMQSEA